MRPRFMEYSQKIRTNERANKWRKKRHSSFGEKPFIRLTAIAFYFKVIFAK